MQNKNQLESGPKLGPTNMATANVASLILLMAAAFATAAIAWSQGQHSQEAKVQPAAATGAQ